MLNNNNYKFKPILYKSPLIDKSRIMKENKKKSGIYCWINIATGKKYVGCSCNLSNRLKTYFSKRSLRNYLLTSNSYIYRAILKYNISNFSLEILEYCCENIKLKREQYFIDLLKPEYNIKKKTGSRLNTKHST